MSSCNDCGSSNIKNNKKRSIHAMESDDGEFNGSSTPGFKTVGSKEDVFYGNAQRTSGGLTKEKLMLNKNGKVVSSAKSQIGKKLYENFQKKDFKDESGDL